MPLTCIKRKLVLKHFCSSFELPLKTGFTVYNQLKYLSKSFKNADRCELFFYFFKIFYLQMFSCWQFIICALCFVPSITGEFDPLSKYCRANQE